MRVVFIIIFFSRCDDGNEVNENLSVRNENMGGRGGPLEFRSVQSEIFQKVFFLVSTIRLLIT